MFSEIVVICHWGNTRLCDDACADDVLNIRSYRQLGTRRKVFARIPEVVAMARNSEDIAAISARVSLTSRCSSSTRCINRATKSTWPYVELLRDGADTALKREGDRAATECASDASNSAFRSPDSYAASWASVSSAEA